MYSTSKRRLSDGFSLIELLAVLGILSLLIALTLPAVHAVREGARSLSCQANLRELALGLSQYEATFGCFPPAYIITRVPGTNGLGTNYSALALSLPYFEQRALYTRDQFHPTWVVSD